MRTLMIVLGGLALLVVSMIAGRYWNGSAGVFMAAQLFVPIWFAATTANLAMGVNAGYKVMEEIPVLLVTFLLPATCSALALWLLPRP